MMDVLERLGVTDKRILRAHNSRGFTYLGGVLEEVDLTNDEVRAAATRMFERMDTDLVLSDAEIPPGCKRMFAELRGMQGIVKVTGLNLAQQTETKEGA